MDSGFSLCYHRAAERNQNPFRTLYKEPSFPSGMPNVLAIFFRYPWIGHTPEEPFPHKICRMFPILPHIWRQGEIGPMEDLGEKRGDHVSR